MPIQTRQFLSARPGRKTSASAAAPCGLLLAALMSAPAVCASEAPQQTSRPRPIFYDIRPQPLDRALVEFSLASGLQVLADGKLTQNAVSPGVSGRLTAAEALRELLRGSGITYRFTGRDTVTLEPETPRPQSSSGAAAHTLPPMRVTADAAYDANDPYNKNYAVPNTGTATKTDTPIMETPVNIQVVPQQVLKDQQAIRIEQALQNASGVYKQQAESAESFNIRGFTTFDYYRDGVRNQSALTQAGDRETANLERIEVLKGPAAILYGRIEPGGLINLVTKQPLERAYYSLQQQFGSFDLYRTTLDATGPVTGNNELLYRFNLAYEDKGSFREFVNNDRVFVAPVVKWKISERTQAAIEMEYKHARESTDFGIPAQGDRPVDIPRERNLGEPFTFSESDEILLGFNWSHEFNEQWKIRHKFNTTFTSEDDDVVIGAGDVAPGSTTFSRFYAGFRDNKTQSYVNSLDLIGRFDAYGVQHTLLMGGDYYIFHNTGLIVDNFNFPAIDILNPVHSGSPIRDPNDDFNFETSEEWFGLYFQDQIKLPYNVHLLAGFRYDNARITYLSEFAGISSANVRADEAVNPRVGLLWQPVPEVSLYGNYVENFGLPNAFSTGFGGTALGPETAQQWEAGIKTEWFDGRLTSTLAWYQLTKQNIATASSDPLAAARGVSEAIGEARNRGIELDVAGEILPGWNMIAGYSYVDSEITQDVGLVFDDLGNVIGTDNGNTGHRFHDVPVHGGSLWNTYRFQNGELQGLTLGAGLVARSQREGNNQNDFQMPGYALVNLMGGYEFKVGKSKVTVQLNVDNLLDKKYFPSSIGFGRSRIDVGAPRTFLGSVRLEF